MLVAGQEPFGTHRVKGEMTLIEAGVLSQLRGMRGYALDTLRKCV